LLQHAFFYFPKCTCFHDILIFKNKIIQAKWKFVNVCICFQYDVTIFVFSIFEKNTMAMECIKIIFIARVNQVVEIEDDFSSHSPCIFFTPLKAKKSSGTINQTFTLKKSSVYVYRIFSRWKRYLGGGKSSLRNWILKYSDIFVFINVYLACFVLQTPPCIVFHNLFLLQSIFIIIDWVELELAFLEIFTNYPLISVVVVEHVLYFLMENVNINFFFESAKFYQWTIP
jgi:hypothetical protein